MRASTQLLLRPSRFSLVWWPTVVGGWLALGTSIWHALPEIARVHDGAALAMCGALLVALELLPLVQGRGHDPQGVVMSTAFVCALLLIWGPSPAIAMVCLAAAVSDYRAGKAWWRLAFNVGQYSLSVGAGYLVMVLFGRSPSLDSSLSTLVPADLIWIACVWIAYFWVNLLLVIGVTSHGRSFWKALFNDFWHYTVMTFAAFGISPLIVVLAQRAWWVLPALLIPLLLMYRLAQMSVNREYEASHDSLTGLVNRTGMELALADLLQADGGALSLLLIDLDHFKEVNDTLGHHVGDDLLSLFARRLTHAVRTGDLVARLGGDEFAVIAPNASGLVANEIGSRIIESLDKPFDVGGISVDIGASIGVAVAPQHACDGKDLLRLADVAMYDAKSAGSGVALYSSVRDRNSADRLSVLGELRRAIAQHELELHYQPKVALDGGGLLGLEALVRWSHPARGLIPPDEFIPLAERSGLMPTLTEAVVNMALAQIASWDRAGLRVPVAVNVTLPDVVGGNLGHLIAQAQRQQALPEGSLLVEITERVMGQHTEQLGAAMRQLQASGIKFSLDDFGTGYSSLLRLQSLPVNELKIDRAFICRLASEPTARGIVASTIDLAHALGIPAIAEGVETQFEWDMLARLGCDGAQGWYICKALPSDAITSWLRHHLDPRGARMLVDAAPESA